MKASRIVVLTLCPALAAILAAVGSCGDENASGSRKPITELNPNADKGDAASEASREAPDASALARDAAPLDPLRDVKNIGQAVQVLLTAYDTEIREGEVGKFSGSSPPVKAFSADLVEDSKAGRSRLKQLAASKKVSPSSSLLNDRMKFETQAAMSHLKNVFSDMFDSTYMSRRIDAATNLLRMIDDELSPHFAEDDDWKNEIATIRGETEKHLARAELVKNGVLEGPGNSDGMFDDDRFDPESNQPKDTPRPASDAGAPASTTRPTDAPVDPLKRRPR